MAEFSELVQALTWLVTNRIQQKIQYTHGLLGDGNGRVRVSTIPGSPEVDYVYVRPDRFSNRTFKVFNKRIEGQDGDPIIIGELPWEPDLVQVVDMDWAAYADVGWGDDVTTTNRHGISHQWRDGAPGIDTFNVYRRQFGDLKTYATVSGTLDVGVSPGTQSFSLAGALPTATGTARMALVYWSPSSGTTQGYLGVATGTLGSGAEATILNRPVSPQGVIPSAFVRLAGGQSSITEFDIWDAREPFRPGIAFGTGTAGLSADMIPISDTVGFYTGSTVEAALMETPYKLIAPDGGINPVFSADVAGNVTLAGTGTLVIPELLRHSGDPDTYWSFGNDQIEAVVGGLSMLKLTETTQDLITLGPGSGDVDIDFNGDLFLRGSNATFGINTTTTAFTEEGSAAPAQLYLLRTNAAGFRGAVYSTESDTPGRNAQNAFIRARVGPAAVQDADRLGDFFFSGHDGTDYNRSARFGAIVDGSVSANTVPTALDFSTSETNSGGLTTRLYIAPDGDVGIGTDAPAAQLHVDQASTTAAQPVLYLDQADISEEMIEFNTTIGIGNAIEAVGAKTLTTTHFIKVTLPGALTRYIPVGTIA
jgi:hypothetical protein